ncbi:MutH/Sau3AI family endonuclease [Peribacillus huizhouensis]|uniref:DNA mismatch repair MutH/Type II restriction enzyme Sau3AI domain-containing protein n=1 Tax=Peribacillus huizhouensis TaxID=1501239 RepID=A0ABR6CRL9_9BACI|nr:MutH/Sau3AI family endonuclease [Peribacillus huizhouensis]MBA9027605.1 hypothetical protein [Peribacillus huizhouensis]
MAGHVFKKSQLHQILDNVVGKSLGEVDKNRVFDRARISPKITGIAGDVIEQSVLGYPADSKQEADLLVDGVPVELKTTGIRKPKKKSEHEFEAKEPMSITAVSPERIVEEYFESSNFWHKLQNLLLVYYHYAAEQTVPALEYANFIIEDYHFHTFSEEDRKTLQNDWELVRTFIEFLQQNYSKPEKLYHSISSELRKQLMLIDIAPKWPNRPRFRLKRTTVSTIVQNHFGQKLEQLTESYTSFAQIDEKLKQITKSHRGKTIRELMDELQIPIKLNKKNDVSKSIAEQIIVRMFGGKAKKLSKIELFHKIGLLPKTLTMTKNGTRTEDTKLFPIDFEEWTEVNTTFEQSAVYQAFKLQQLLFILFEEPSSDAKLLDNKFQGFKRFVFPDSIIEQDLQQVWLEVRRLIHYNELRDEIEYGKDGKPQINKSGTLKTSVNFPKSKDYDIFIRGSGKDSTIKPVTINNIAMYRQNVWVKGSTLVALLHEQPFIE